MIKILYFLQHLEVYLNVFVDALFNYSIQLYLGQGTDQAGFLCQAPQVFVLCGGPFDAKGAWADSISGCPYSLVTSDLSDNEKAS